jgi:NAD(P)-dependent dehydrogenase (short-subunit alcohol dehydrogenase family)
MRRFTNKIVVITGGTSGIGLAAAKQFIKEGAKVVVTGRSPQSVGDAQNESAPMVSRSLPMSRS